MTSAGYCIAIFILWLTCVYLAESRCPYDVEGCSCYSRSMTCTHLNTLPPLQTGSDVTAIEEARFYFGNISDIPDNALPPGLVLLQFNDDSLTNISDGAFNTLADTLRILSIYSAKFKRLPAALLKLSHLTSLELHSTSLDQWDDAILQHLAISLTSLTVSYGGLIQWPTWLSYFHSLTGLEVSFNKITPIPDDAFSSSKDTLVQLSLHTTGLTQIPQALSILQNLTDLDLSGNRLTEVSGRPGIEQLSSLTLAHTLLSLSADFSRLSVIPDFSNLTHLVEISLGFNQISDPAVDSLSLSVTTLYLHGNSIASVPAKMAKLTMLSRLDLSVNDIEVINLDILPTTLTYLDLQSNQIYEINDSISTTISRLNTLDLAHNPLSAISPLAFKNLVFLKYLYLDDTKLTQIPLALTSLTRLTYLSIRIIPYLNCPCPPPTELVLWRQSLPCVSLYGPQCNNTLDINDYLSHSCQTNPPVQ